MKIHASEPAKQQNQPSSSQPFIRPKLNINTPGDAYEQEADSTADKVMRMKTPSTPDSARRANGRYYDPWRPHVRDPFVTPRGYNRNGEYYDPYRPQDTEPFGPRPKPQAVQRKHHGPDEYLEGEKLSRKEISIERKCSSCEEEDKMVHRKENKEEEKTLHRKEGTSPETQAGSSLDSYVNSLGSSGQPLPDASRQFFEARFGHDFSDVKIHNDSAAAKSAQSINALAYTTGNNIVFNEGQFAPGSDSGDRLLAHELTHVVQQDSAHIQTKIQRICTDDEKKRLNDEMHKYYDQPRSCNPQTDTCETATAKVAAGTGAVTLRTLIQQKCFRKGDPNYEKHMKEIAEASKVLRNCQIIMMQKCGIKEAEAVAKAEAKARAAAEAAKALETTETREGAEAIEGAEGGAELLEILEMVGLLLL